MIHDDSVMIQVDSAPIQTNSQPIQGDSSRFRAPRWFEFEAATPVNQRCKALRVCGFVCMVSGAVVLAYQSRPPTEQALALLGCILYVLCFDPFAAVGAILARASRFILASAICLIGAAVIVPCAGTASVCVVWSLVAVAVVRRFNMRYLMQDTFASSRAIPDAIRTAPESKAGQAWRHGGAKTVNAMAAEIGATCRDYAEVKARELSYYIGYQQADGRTQELVKRLERLRLENTMLRDAERERDELLQTVDQMEADRSKDRERASAERRKLIKKIHELEEANAELTKYIPAEVQTDDTESKLEYAFLTLHLSDSKAAEYAGCAQAKAWRYRKDRGIEPKGGST